MENFSDEKDKDRRDSLETENPDEESNPTGEKFRRLIKSGEESEDSQKIQNRILMDQFWIAGGNFGIAF